MKDKSIVVRLMTLVMYIRPYQSNKGSEADLEMRNSCFRLFISFPGISHHESHGATCWQ